MLKKTEEQIIKRCAQKYNVSAIFLFGSSLGGKSINDIDIAVKGLNPALFFDFYAELFKQLPKKVDLVDLDETDIYFATRILEGGKILYEA